MTDNPAPQQTYRPIVLNNWARTGSGALGLAFGGAGGYSVFANTNQAGSTALLLIGGIFLLMTLTGRVPERMGKDGIVHEATERAIAATEAITDLMDDDSETVRSAAAETYLRNREEVARWVAGAGARTSSDVTINVPAVTVSGALMVPGVDADDANLRTAHAIRHQRNVHNLLVEAFGADAVEWQPSFPSFRPDAVVTLPSGKRVAVEAKAGRQRKHKFLEWAPTAKAAGLDGVVVVQDMGYQGVSPQVTGTANVRNVLIATDGSGIDQESAEAVVNEIKRFG